MPTGTPMPVVAQPKPAQTDTVSTLHGRVAAADTGQTVKLELSLIE